MDTRYSRNIPALSAEECILLQSKHVAVIGCGGLGGHLIDLAARIGIGTIRAVDCDVFEESNLNRQLLCEESYLGKPKAHVAAEHIARINSHVVCEPIVATMTTETASELIADCDIAFDALDNIDARRILAQEASAANIPVAYGAIRGWVTQTAIYLPGKPFIDLLYPVGTQLNDKSVLAFTPAYCAAMQMALAVKWLVGRPVQTNTLYYADLLNQEFETIPLL